MLLKNILTFYLIAMAVTSIYWAVHIRAVNGSDYSHAAVWLCLAICFYIFGYAIELNSSTRPQILFWNRVEYVGIPFVSPLWLTTGLMYTGRFNRHKKAWIALLYIIPIVTMILRITNYRHLYFAAENFCTKDGMLFFVKRTGPWMYVQNFHSMLMALAALGVFICDSVRGAEKQTGKFLLVTAASVSVVVGLLLKMASPFGLPVDYMAGCLSAACIMIIMAICRYDLLETRAAARNKVFQASSDAILLIDRRGKIWDYNRSAGNFFARLHICIDNGYLDTLLRGSPDLLAALKKPERTVIRLQADGGERYLDIVTQSMDDHSVPKGWIKTIRDVTEIYRLNAELQKQAMTDALSALHNRRSFLQIGEERIGQAERQGVFLHLLMMDLDHFKTVNDRYGHPAGDMVIREFGRMLRNHFGGQCLTARLGGEEFSALLSGFSDAEVWRRARALLTESERYVYVFRENRFTVTVSIGIAKGQPGLTLESLMSAADRALYESKQGGRDCITFTEGDAVRRMPAD